MSEDTGYFAPVVLADARERRARKQRPYPAVCEHMPIATHLAIAEADEREAAARAGRSILPAAVLVVGLLIALVVTLALLALKG